MSGVIAFDSAAYAAGLPVIRTAVFIISLVGLGMMLCPLLVG